MCARRTDEICKQWILSADLFKSFFCSLPLSKILFAEQMNWCKCTFKRVCYMQIWWLCWIILSDQSNINTITLKRIYAISNSTIAVHHAIFNVASAYDKFIVRENSSDLIARKLHMLCQIPRTVQLFPTYRADFIVFILLQHVKWTNITKNTTTIYRRAFVSFS